MILTPFSLTATSTRLLNRLAAPLQIPLIAVVAMMMSSLLGWPRNLHGRPFVKLKTHLRYPFDEIFQFLVLAVF